MVNHTVFKSALNAILDYHEDYHDPKQNLIALFKVNFTPNKNQRIGEELDINDL